MASLALQGAYLDQTGGVVAAPPAVGWAWEDGAPALPFRQRGFTRQVAGRAREALLATLDEGDRARVRSCGGPGAGAWVHCAPTSRALQFTDLEYRVSTRLRLGVPLGLGGARELCRNRYATRERRGEECRAPLGADGYHALTCLIGGRPIRRHHGLRDLAAELGRDAGYHATTKHREPAWARVRVGVDGREEHEHADLDVRLERPPDDPLTYLDVVVTHPEGEAWR